MKYYASRTLQHPSLGHPDRISIYRFSSKSTRDWFIKRETSTGAAVPTFCEPVTAKQARDLAPCDMFGDKYVIDDHAGVVYPYGTPGHDAYTLDYFRKYPATIPTARDVDDLARLDMHLLQTVRDAIERSTSQYAPAARERIDAMLNAR